MFGKTNSLPLAVGLWGLVPFLQEGLNIPWWAWLLVFIIVVALVLALTRGGSRTTAGRDEGMSIRSNEAAVLSSEIQPAIGVQVPLVPTIASDLREIPVEVDMPELRNVSYLRDIPETPPMHDVLDVPVVQDMPELRNVPDLRDIPETPPMRDMRDVPVIQDMPELRDVPDLRDRLETTPMRDVPVEDEIQGLQDVPDWRDVPDLSAVANTDDIPFTPSATSPDDLTIIEGIGPRINDILHRRGVTTFQQLNDMDMIELERILAADNLGIADPASWSEQARLAASGDWEALQRYQAQRKGGREEG